jgi:hypothetical protein
MSYFFFERRVVPTELDERKPGDHSQLLSEKEERHQIVLDVPNGRTISDRKLAAIRDALEDDATAGVFYTRRVRRERGELHSTVRDRRLQALQTLTSNRRNRGADGESASHHPA